MWFKLISFVFLAGCVWVAVEVYTEGSDRAFGGVLSGLGSSSSTPGLSQTATPLERIQGSASGARDRQLSRLESQLEGDSVGLSDRREHASER